MGVAYRVLDAIFKGPDKLMKVLIFACLFIIFCLIFRFEILTDLWGVGLCVAVASYVLVWAPLRSFESMQGFYCVLFLLSIINIGMWIRTTSFYGGEIILVFLLAFSMMLLMFCSIGLHKKRYPLYNQEVRKDIEKMFAGVEDSI